jgi:thioredoxin-like negative regulator of GroEL
MDIINSDLQIDTLIKEETMVLVYFAGEGCGVCNVIRPKIEELMKNYPKIKTAIVEVEKSIEVAANYSIFTIPAVLLFIEGKEVLRGARYINIMDIKEKIERYYEMLF